MCIVACTKACDAYKSMWYALMCIKAYEVCSGLVVYIEGYEVCTKACGVYQGI